MDNTTLEQYLHIGSMIETGELDRQKVQAIIEGRLATPSAPSIREAQARRLYELKFGDVLGVKTFEAYLDGTDAIEAVPLIPYFPEVQVRLFGRENVWLVDGRVAEKVGPTEYLRLVGLGLSGTDDDLVPHDLMRVRSGIRWMIGQDGFRNRGRKPKDCRRLFQFFEVGMDWVEGAAVYALNPKVINGHRVDLLGSVHRNECDLFHASLVVVGSGPRLCYRSNVYSDLLGGSSSRGE